MHPYIIYKYILKQDCSLWKNPQTHKIKKKLNGRKIKKPHVYIADTLGKDIQDQVQYHGITCYSIMYSHLYIHLYSTAISFLDLACGSSAVNDLSLI